MEQTLKKIISKIDADYCDVRYERMNKTEISFNGKELSQIGSNTTDGYVIRVLRNGGFTNVAVTRPEDIDAAIKAVSASADIFGREAKKPVQLEIQPPVIDDVPLTLIEDPRKIELDEKLRTLSHYNDIALKSPNIQTTTMIYEEVYRDRFFLSSNGTSIHEPLLTTAIRGQVVAKKDNLIQNVRVGMGGSDGFNRLRNREALVLEKAKIASDLLDAQPVSSGTYNVILDPNMAGVFVHEAFGHFSEADIIENKPSLREKMQIGSKLGSELVNILDDATKRGQLGYYKYDDEGVAVRPVVLMENGILKGRLHSIRTAKAFNEPVSGHCVAEDYRFAPIIRMGCIYIRPGRNTFDELLQQAGDGIYVCQSKGGQTSGGNFTFGAQYGYLIQNGKLGPIVRDLNVMGNLFTSLESITGLSDGFVLGETGGCGKGQMNIRSCNGGCHVFMRNTLIGGV